MKEVEFRDGTRLVPDHVEAMLTGIDTHRLTYREAIKAGEDRIQGDHVYRAQRSLIRDHFKETP